MLFFPEATLLLSFFFNFQALVGESDVMVLRTPSVFSVLIFSSEVVGVCLNVARKIVTGVISFGRALGNKFNSSAHSFAPGYMDLLFGSFFCFMPIPISLDFRGGGLPLFNDERLAFSSAWGLWIMFSK